MLDIFSDFADWQPLARRLLLAGVPPDAVSWGGSSTDDLFSGATLDWDALPEAPSSPPLRVSRSFVQVARYAASHRDPQRFDLLYRLLWRLHYGEPRLMHDSQDALVFRANRLAKEVGRDRHKMTAFVRFRELHLKEVGSEAAAAPLFIAWYEPEHYILRLASSFFCERFTSMNWSILTPYQSLHWLERELYTGGPARREDAPQSDAMEEAWLRYYASIFNPARLKVNAMCAEMPKKFWKNLPEATLISRLIRSAQVRSEAMIAAPASATGNLPMSAKFDRRVWLERQQN